MVSKLEMRKPIVTFAGHIDHGKTSILDFIRETAIAKKEAGLITQKISFTEIPLEFIKKKCSNLLRKFNFKIKIPGFLFIDTPGHAAFSNLRKRGGSLADLAVLVVDINEGLMEQTIESIEILKMNKVPFIVALNKIDKIPGWRFVKKELSENLDEQEEFTREQFDKLFYKILNQFSSQGFDCDLFFRINNFTKQLCLVPCSAKTGEGIQELIVMLAGLAQKFLIGKLKIGKRGKGTILEIRKDKFTFIEAILYDGKIEVNDNILVAGLEEPVISKVRSIFKAKPLSKGFETEKIAKAACGLRLQLTISDVLPGMPFVVIEKKENENKIKSLKEEIQREISEKIKLDKKGVIVKADSLGSLEALITLLRKKGIKIERASIGNITKVDITTAEANLKENPLDAVILGFNIKLEEDVKIGKVKVLIGDVIYKLIEDFEKWKEEKKIEIEREKLSELVLPFKIKMLPGFIFRKSKPAIFGIKVLAGTIKPNCFVMNQEGKVLGKIKNIQFQNRSIEEASKGQEVAISIPEITIGRQLKEQEVLYSNLTENEFRNLKKNKKLLKSDELQVLQEIAGIKRSEKPTWGI